MKSWFIFLLMGMLWSCAHSMEFTDKQSPSGLNYSGYANKVFFSAQPTVDQIRYLKTVEKVDVVFNLRNPEEMVGGLESFGKEVQTMGITYYNLPVRPKNQLDPASLKTLEATFMKHHKAGDKILLHCSSGNRVGAWLATHLYYHHKEPIDVAIANAKKAGLTKEGLILETRELLQKNKDLY